MTATDTLNRGAFMLGGSGADTLAGGTQTFESIYKDEATGTTYVKLDGGNSLAIFKEGEADRILVRDWASGRLGIEKFGAGGAAMNNLSISVLQKRNQITLTPLATS